MKPVSATFLASVLLLPLASLDASEPRKFSAKETDSRLRAEGTGWGLNKAKIVDPTRPRVLLVGDSITSGYHRDVLAALEGKAYVDVWQNPYWQSEQANRVLAEVLEQGPYDVVHANMGLHGWPVGRIKEGTFEPLMRAYIEVIRTKLPTAEIIWANSTPVRTKGKPGELDPVINANILEQNRMSAKVMHEMNVPVSDFYSLLVGRLELAKTDQFHWTPPAYKILADAAAAGIIKALEQKFGPAAVSGSAGKSSELRERHELKSPDGRVTLEFGLTGEGAPVYSIGYRGRTIIVQSHLGLELKAEPGFTTGLKVTGTERGRHDETWSPVAAERSTIRDHYNSLFVTLEGRTGGRLQLAFRSYDEGAGFRYILPAQAGRREVTISDEVTEFRFDGDYPCWPVYNAQGVYQGGFKLSDVKKNCERPLTVQLAGGPCVAVGEAGMVDYFRMRLQPSGQPNGLKVLPNGEATGQAPFSTPWRFVMVADTPGQLAERNHLVLNFNDPSVIKDTSWIKPGKVFRVMTLSTEGAKTCVDFAAKMGFQYILFDAGWYGTWRQPESDASRWYVEKPGSIWNATRTKMQTGDGPPLDIKAVVQYGNTKGIGVILYVDRAELERQWRQLYPLYREWGVKGVKLGCVQVGTQEWAKWISDNVRLLAENRLMADIHDEYRLTGTSRTWPNLLTAEGVSGDEACSSAEHTATLPFTRGLCGPFDNTACFYDKRLSDRSAWRPSNPKRAAEDVRKSRAFQLAKAVIVFSPLQHLFWYDKPEMYQGEPELEFWKTVPVTWDETRVINGVIGQHVTQARRKGREWYVGSVNALQRRPLEIPLNFLEPGRKYRAEIYSEAAPGSRETTDLNRVKIERSTVDATTVIKADLSDIGGHCMRLVPID